MQTYLKSYVIPGILEKRSVSLYRYLVNIQFNSAYSRYMFNVILRIWQRRPEKSQYSDEIIFSTAFKGIVHRDLTVVKTRLKQSV